MRLPSYQLSWSSPLEGVDPDPATLDHEVWAEIAPVRLTPTNVRAGFVQSEFSDPDAMDAHFLRWLYATRLLAGVPFRVISSARDPHGSVGASLSAHKKRPCRAVDLQALNNYERARIVIAAARQGCVRIGVYPSDEHGKGGVHLDCETDPANPSPRIWTRY